MCTISKITNSMRHLIKKFRSDSNGTAATEFALILPIMIFIFFGTIEISKLYIEKNQVEDVSEIVADLVTQGKSITTDQLED
ncbi:unnamed protein product, partial [Scytosiphon promiscuus]